MKRVVSSSLISLVILLLIAGGFFYYQYYRSSSSSALETIPADAAWLVSCDPSSGELRQLAKTGFFTGHDSIDVLNEWYHALIAFDSLVSNTPLLKEHFAQHPLLVSGHVTGPNGFSLLFTSGLEGGGEHKAANLIKPFVHGDGAGAVRNYNGVDIREIALGKSRQPFTWAVSHGVFVGSFTPYLIEDAIRQQRNGKVPSPATRLKVFLEGKERSLVMAIRYATFQRWVGTQLNPNAQVSLSPLQRVGDWSVARLNIHSNLISFSGTTTLNDSIEFLKIFKEQKSVENKLVKLLPARTAAAVVWGFSDTKVFTRQLGEYLNQVQNQSDAAHGDRSSLMPYFQPWMGHELGLCVTQPVGNGSENHFFAFIGVQDPVLCKKMLQECARNISKGTSRGDEEEYYNGFAIRYLPLQGIMPSLFGGLFNKVNHFYYAIVDNFVVVANQASSLRGIINDIKTGNLLVSDARYPALSATVPSKSNLFFYGGVPQATGLFSAVAAPHWVNWLSQHGGNLKDWNGLVFSVANQNGVFATNGSLSYFKAGESGTHLSWSTKLDAAVAAGPFLAGRSNPQIIVQDEQHYLYGIERDGAIHWKKKLDSRIRGNAHTIDFYKNGEEQVVFNTGSFLYVLDSAGNSLPNFPLRLPAAASSGTSLYQPKDGSEDACLFVACSNFRVYCYTLTGKAMPSFSSLGVPELVSDEIHFLRQDGNLRLLVRAQSGTAFWCDRNGGNRQTIKAKIETTPGATLHFTNDSSMQFYWVSKEGVLQQADGKGQVTVAYQAEGDTLTDVAFCDLNGDEIADRVFTGLAGLQAVTSDDVVLFNNKNNSVAGQPQIISFNNRNYIGYSTLDEGQFYLLNAEGSIYNGFPLPSKTKGLSMRLADGGMAFIVQVDDHSIALYSIQ